jgi:hypothetical protein
MAEPMAGVSEAREQAHGWYMLAPWSRAHSSTIMLRLCMLGVCAIGARGRAREGGTQTRPTQRDLADTLRRSGSRPNTSRARRKTVRRVLQLILGQRATLQLALTMKSKQANQRTPDNGRVHMRSMLSLVFRSSLEVPAAGMTIKQGGQRVDQFECRGLSVWRIQPIREQPLSKAQQLFVRFEIVSAHAGRTRSQACQASGWIPAPSPH